MLTLQEIENISFRKSGLGGYKTEDVDMFVDGVIEKVRDLELQNRDLENRIYALNSDIQKHKEKEESVQDAIITAEMTSKQVIRDSKARAEEIESTAQEKADKLLSEAEEKAEKLLSEAQAKADDIDAVSSAKAEDIIQKALRESSESIDENNLIIERQKQSIIELQSEVSKFRETLLEQYKNHLKVISSLPKAEDFRQYQENLQERYPAESANKPVSAGEDLKEESSDQENDIPEDDFSETEESVDLISEEISSESESENQEKEENTEDSLSEDTKEEVSDSDKSEDSTDIEAPKEEPDDFEPEPMTFESISAYEKVKRERERRLSFEDEESSDSGSESSTDGQDEGDIFSSEEAENDFRAYEEKKVENKRSPVNVQNDESSKFGVLSIDDIETEPVSFGNKKKNKK